MKDKEKYLMDFNNIQSLHLPLYSQDDDLDDEMDYEDDEDEI